MRIPLYSKISLLGHNISIKDRRCHLLLHSLLSEGLPMAYKSCKPDKNSPSKTLVKISAFWLSDSIFQTTNYYPTFCLFWFHQHLLQIEVLPVLPFLLLVLAHRCVFLGQHNGWPEGLPARAVGLHLSLRCPLLGKLYRQCRHLLCLLLSWNGKRKK